MIKPLTELSGLDALAEAEPALAATAASSVAAFRDEPERLRCFGEYDEAGTLVAAADLTSREILLICERSAPRKKSGLFATGRLHEGITPREERGLHELNGLREEIALCENSMPREKRTLCLQGGPSGEMLDFLKKMIPGGDFAGIRCSEKALPALRREFSICERKEPVMACSSLSAPPSTEFQAEPPRRFSDVWALLAEADAEFAGGDPEAWVLRLSRGVRRGQTAVWAIYDGEKPAATASVLGRCGSCGVIAGVATRPEYRGRGMASCLTYLCAKELLDSGRTAWLVPSGESSERLYGALGFRRIYFQYYCKIRDEEPT